MSEGEGLRVWNKKISVSVREKLLCLREKDICVWERKISVAGRERILFCLRKTNIHMSASEEERSVSGRENPSKGP